MTNTHRQSSPMGANFYCPPAERKLRSVLRASLFGVAAVFLPVLSGQAQTVAPTPPVAPQTSAVATAPPLSPQMAARVKHDSEMRDKRIADMHKRLELTPAQESFWAPVATAMRDNSTAFDAVVMKISDEKMTAVDHLTAFEAMADEHAAGLHRLIPPFSALYATMSDNQKQTANHMFDGHGREHANRR